MRGSSFLARRLVSGDCHGFSAEAGAVLSGSMAVHPPSDKTAKDAAASQVPQAELKVRLAAMRRNLVMILPKVAKLKDVAVTALPAGLADCSPMTEIGGAYFPAWLLCMLAGLILTLLCRAVLIRLRLDLWVRPRALAYPCLGVAIALLVHLIFFSA